MESNDLNRLSLRLYATSVWSLLLIDLKIQLNKILWGIVWYNFFNRFDVRDLYLIKSRRMSLLDTNYGASTNILRILNWNLSKISILQFEAELHNCIPYNQWHDDYFL